MNEDMELTAAAKTWLNLMWRSIEDKIRATVGHHHWIHEPGGPDQIVLPFGALKDVDAPDPADRDVPIFNFAEKLWQTGPMEGGAGKAEIVGGMFGTLVVGSATVAYTNLKAAAISYNKIKIACQPAAPTGGIGVTVYVGAHNYTLTISASATASAVTTLEAAEDWESGSDIYATITTLSGSYTGTILAMVADGE